MATFANEPLYNKNARQTMKLLIVRITLGLSLSCSVTYAQAPDRKPNVVLVMTDDQGYGDVGAHGNEMIVTVNMDRLRAESVRLTDFHVDPTCSPTRSALMSGRYSTRTGVWHTIMGRSLMSTEEVTIAEVLKVGGYRTGMFGKWHLGENAPLRPQDQGFDEAFYHGGGGVGQGPDYWGNDYFDDTYFRNGKEEKVEGYCTDVWFADALRFIEENRERPFFAYISTNAPHGPYNVAEKYSRPYVEKGVPGNMAKFYGMITNIDENLGRLVAKLKALELAENTILIFMTDNGTAAGLDRGRRRNGAPGRWSGFNAGMRAGKGSEYDGGHRVPFFIRWPAGGIGGGRDVDKLSAHVDVLPTLAELCGVKAPAGVRLDGASLAGLLKGERDTVGERTLFVHSQRIPYPEKWRKSAVMTERWRLINGKELFDILADPGQRNNLALMHEDVVKKLRMAYDGWWESLRPVFDDSVRIHLGSGAENPVRLHVHDWHVKSQKDSPWHQNHVRSGHIGNGFWAVDVRKAGVYRFTLRRWPAHVDQPMEAKSALLQIAGKEARARVAEGARQVRFELSLPAGPTRLQTRMTLPSGKERGAYFVTVESL